MYLNSSEYPCTAGSIITTSTNKQTNKYIMDTENYSLQ